MSAVNEAADYLFVGPHPDDIELFAGGLAALRAAAGDRVVLVDLTAGELASNGTVEQRAAEAAAAAAVLGAAARVNLALPDGGLNGMDAAQVGRLMEVIRQWRPRFVVAPWSVERHPDHEQAHALVRRAVFMAGLAKFGEGAPHRVKEVLWYPMRFEAAPRILVDISSVMETKYAAIVCHGSQVAPMDRGGRPPVAPTTLTEGDGDGGRAPVAPTGGTEAGVLAVATLVGSARNLEVLRARDAYWGGVAGSQAAEPYVTDRVPVTTDPALCFGGSGGDGDVYVFAAGSRGEA